MVECYYSLLPESFWPVFSSFLIFFLELLCQTQIHIINKDNKTTGIFPPTLCSLCEVFGLKKMHQMEDVIIKRQHIETKSQLYFQKK